MAKQLLCDSFDFKIDRTHLAKSLTEARQAGRNVFPMAIRGRLGLAEAINGNKRRYPKRVWEKNTAPDSYLMKQVNGRKALGLLEHPADGKVDLNSPICSLTTGVWMEGNEVSGEITIVGTAEGMKLAALIEGGYNPTVSSRGFGSVEVASDGVDDVQDDYVCESWDVVSVPSVDTAVLDGGPCREAMLNGTKPITEAAPTAVAKTAVETLFAAINAGVNEGLISADSVRIEGGKVVLANTIVEAGDKFKWSLQKACKGQGNNEVCSYTGTRADAIEHFKAKCAEYKPDAQGICKDGDYTYCCASECGSQCESTIIPPSGSPAGVSKPTTTTTMDYKALSESVRNLTATVEVSKLDSRSLAEGRARAQELHREIAAAQAATPANAWDCQQLHETLTRYESAINEAVEAPRREVSRLQENHVKTLKVLRTVTESGIGFKRQLAKALTETSRKGKLLETVVTRAKGWEKRARIAEARLATATATLNEQQQRYNEDTAALGRRLVIVEFGVTDAAELKRIAEAVTTDAIADIRDGFKKQINEGKRAKSVLTRNGKPITEAVVPPAGVLPVAAPAAASSVATSVTVLPTARPFSISESTGLARRLSGTAV